MRTRARTMRRPRRLLRGSFADPTDRPGLSFALKATNAGGGRLDFLIETEADFPRHVEDRAHTKAAFLAQRFVPHNGTFRTPVFGRDVPIVMHRCGTDGSHLTDTERDGRATLFDVETFEADVLDTADRAVEVMGCEIAGLNLVQDRHTRQWYPLEVGSGPAVGTGAFAEQKTRAYSACLRSKLSAGTSAARL